MAAGAGGSSAGDGMVVWPRAEETANKKARYDGCKFHGNAWNRSKHEDFYLIRKFFDYNPATRDDLD